jgi:hypothetical protein
LPLTPKFRQREDPQPQWGWVIAPSTESLSCLTESFNGVGIELPEQIMLHDHPVPVDACGIVEVPGENKVCGIGLCLDCYVGAFAIEFHEDDVEVAGICSVRTLLDPSIQLFDGA